MPAPTEPFHPVATEIAERIWRHLGDDRRGDPAAVLFWTRRSTDSRRAICIVVGYSGPETGEVYEAAMQLLHDRVEARIGTRFTWHEPLPCPACEGEAGEWVTLPDPSSPCGAQDLGYELCTADGCKGGHVACDLCGESAAVLQVGRFAPVEVCSSPGCVKDAVGMCADDGVVANEFSAAAPAEVVDTRGHQEARV